jgi:hypothetical protein
MAEWEGKTNKAATDNSGNLVGEKQWEEVQKKVDKPCCNFLTEILDLH